MKLAKRPGSVYSDPMSEIPKAVIVSEMTEETRQLIANSLKPDPFDRDPIMITGIEHLVLFYPPLKAQFDRFTSLAENKKQDSAIDGLIADCLIYPDKETFLDLCDQHPGYRTTLANMALKEAGANPSADTKKFLITSRR